MRPAYVPPYSATEAHLLEQERLRSHAVAEGQRTRVIKVGWSNRELDADGDPIDLYPMRAWLADPQLHPVAPVVDTDHATPDDVLRQVDALWPIRLDERLVVQFDALLLSSPRTVWWAHIIRDLHGRVTRHRADGKAGDVLVVLKG